MEISNEMNVGSREQLRAWLSENHDSCDEVWIVCCRSGRVHTCGLPYLDVVYEALCFGWIDSTCKRVGDKMLQRLTPRKKGSNWTELNKARFRYLEREGTMTDAGRAVFPYLLETEFTIDDIIVEELRKHPVAMDNFSRFPELYKRVKIGNIQMKRNNSDLYRRRLDKFIRFTCRNKMYGEWNDNGRLSQIYENK